jgi:hypothetical protein
MFGGARPCKQSHEEYRASVRPASVGLASLISCSSSQRACVTGSLIDAGLPPRHLRTPEVDFDEISASRRPSTEFDGRSPGSGLRRSRLPQSRLSPTLTTGVVRKSGVEKSPRSPGDLEDSGDEFEPPSTLSTAPRCPVIPPTLAATRISAGRTDPPAAPDLDPITPAGNSRQGAKDRRLVIKQPEEVIEIQRYAHRLGSGGTEWMWRWSLTRPLKFSILDGAGTCQLSWSRVSQRRMSRSLWPRKEYHTSGQRSGERPESHPDVRSEDRHLLGYQRRETTRRSLPMRIPQA